MLALGEVLDCGMSVPRYFFSIRDGVDSIDAMGIDFPNQRAAEFHARSLARTFLPGDSNGRCVIVTDTDGVEVYRTKITG
jgi:hypothetical protein